MQMPPGHTEEMVKGRLDRGQNRGTHAGDATRLREEDPWDQQKGKSYPGGRAVATDKRASEATRGVYAASGILKRTFLLGELGE